MYVSPGPRHNGTMFTRHGIKLSLKCALTLSLTAVTAAVGTVSPQLTSMAPNQPVQVIVQYVPSLIGDLLSTVCGVLNPIELLPTGELCSMTASAAINLANNSSVAHVSVDNTLQGLGTSSPVSSVLPV
jgi:hypothetical protein